MEGNGAPRRKVRSEPVKTRRAPEPVQAAPVTEEGGEDSLGSTITGIVEDLQEIVRGEVQLAKTELKEDAVSIGKGAGFLAGGALLALTGFVFFMLGVTYLLNTAIKMWQAAGLVGLALLGLGAILALVGKNQLSASNLKPEETIDSLKEDQEWANRQIKSARK